MDIFDVLTQLSRHGVAVLRACRERSPYDVASTLGISRNQAKAWARVADAFLGPADSPRKQAEAIRHSEVAGHSVERLVMIDRHARKLPGRGMAWALRAELVAMEGTFEEVNKHGHKRVAEILREEAPQPPRPSVRISATHDGMRTMFICDTERRITDLEKTLDALRNPELPRSAGMSEALWNALSDGTTITPQYRTVIAVGLSDAAAIWRGEGDDVRLGLSDGTTMTGREYLEVAAKEQLGDDIFAGLFHPERGPVNLYRERLASFKQRVLAMAENLICPWPDCKVPADRCHIHHITAHHHGGLTEPTNLTPLCPHHNSANDDDPNAPPRRGRIERDGGHVRYRSPGGRSFRNERDVAELGAMEIIKRLE